MVPVRRKVLKYDTAKPSKATIRISLQSEVVFLFRNPEVDYCLSATAVRVLQTTDPNIRVLGFRV